jgi:hypothetical protein
MYVIVWTWVGAVACELLFFCEIHHCPTSIFTHWGPAGHVLRRAAPRTPTWFGRRVRGARTRKHCVHARVRCAPNLATRVLAAVCALARRRQAPRVAPFWCIFPARVPTSAFLKNNNYLWLPSLIVTTYFIFFGKENRNFLEKHFFV